MGKGSTCTELGKLRTLLKSTKVTNVLGRDADPTRTILVEKLTVELHKGHSADWAELSNSVVIAQGKNNKTTHSIMRPLFAMPMARLFFWHVDLSCVDSVDNIMWRAAIDGATH
jgi:hypothetical protein